MKHLKVGLHLKSIIRRGKAQPGTTSLNGVTAKVHVNKLNATGSTLGINKVNIKIKRTREGGL